MGIPCLQEPNAMLGHNGPQPIEFMGPKAGRFREVDGAEPKLHDAIAMLDKDVRGFGFFKAEEEETKAGVS
jgi:hypothetical protein